MTLLYTLCLILGAAGALLIGRYADKIGLIDAPNHRSSHSIPTPKGGGIGILIAFILLCVATHQSLLFILPVIVISLLGLFSDRIELSPLLRLFLQFCAAALIISSFFDTSHSILSYLLIPFWMVFVVGTANFYNFMDGINGIAGITGCVAFSLIAWFTPAGTDTTLTNPIALALALSCIGFLPFNLFKAKVFMGDVGSILLGFLFAVLVMTRSENFVDFLCFSALLFPFYIDELSTMALRIKNGDRLTQAHRKHIYQILANELRIAHWKVSLGYGMLQLGVGLLVFSIRPLGLLAVCLFLLLSAALYLLAAFSIRKRANSMRLSQK